MGHKIHERRLTEVLTFVCMCVCVWNKTNLGGIFELFSNYESSRAGDSRMKGNEFNIFFEL